MLQLKVTIVRQGDDRESLQTALAVMELDGVLQDASMNVGIVRDNDGLVAVWELEEF